MIKRCFKTKGLSQSSPIDLYFQTIPTFEEYRWEEDYLYFPTKPRVQSPDEVKRPDVDTMQCVWVIQWPLLLFVRSMEFVYHTQSPL